jgi:hypothetical protein
MGNIIHLFCCGAIGAMCAYLDISFNRWEYWVLIALVIIPYHCGKYDGKNDEGGK